MNIVLVALNAKYTHTNLAIRSIAGYCRDSAGEIGLLEFTINNDYEYILRSIYEEKPSVIGFSCYIWNIGMVLSLAASLRKLLPETLLVAGGPEVSFEVENSPELDVFDIVVSGEGEQVFNRLASIRIKNENESKEEFITMLEAPGIELRREGGILVMRGEEVTELEKIPFAYSAGFEAYSKKIVYYEASRGCPFNCAYCLSGASEGIRFLSAERIKSDLKKFLQAGLRKVKFVDRTFNCNRDLAKEIWRFLLENDNKITNFHFELAADLIDGEMIEILSKARKGYFQLEIGIQTVNESTLKLINRDNDLKVIAENVSRISEAGNIHLHLDLIAGLPKETRASFAQAFNYVYGLNPECLQLGFLKLLKGSVLRVNAESLGIVFREDAPYEVLFTKDLCYDDLTRLRRAAEAVDMYYNSGIFGHSLRYLVKAHGNAMDFFISLGDYLDEISKERQAFGKFKLYEALIDFRSFVSSETNTELFFDLLKLDMLLNENVGNNPKWFTNSLNLNEKAAVRRFYENPANSHRFSGKLDGRDARQLSRMCRVEKFSYDITEYISSGKTVLCDSFILFNYYSDSFNFDGVNCEFSHIEL